MAIGVGRRNIKLTQTFFVCNSLECRRFTRGPWTICTQFPFFGFCPRSAAVMDRVGVVVNESIWYIVCGVLELMFLGVMADE